jgi:hypothetical protein
VEVTNKMFRLICRKLGPEDEWDDFIPDGIQSINGCACKATGISPFEVNKVLPTLTNTYTVCHRAENDNGS